VHLLTKFKLSENGFGRLKFVLELNAFSALPTCMQVHCGFAFRLLQDIRYVDTTFNCLKRIHFDSALKVCELNRQLFSRMNEF